MVTLVKSALYLVAGACLLGLAMPSGAQPYSGSQLMTSEEWARHQTTLRSLSPGEQEAYRAQHHQEMKRRAEAMGLTLPDQPPPSGMGGEAGRSFQASRVLDGPRGPGYWEPRYGGWGRPDGRRGRGRPWHRGWGG